MEGLAQDILNGLLLGGLYAIVAIGMSTMFGIVKLVNLAHGIQTMFKQTFHEGQGIVCPSHGPHVGKCRFQD